MSTANGALPWILFHRDRARFAEQFPELEIDEIRLLMPLRYLLSGGVSMRALVPDWTFGFWSAFEQALEPVLPEMAMFAYITLRRR